MVKLTWPQGVRSAAHVHTATTGSRRVCDTTGSLTPRAGTYMTCCDRGGHRMKLASSGYYTTVVANRVQWRNVCALNIGAALAGWWRDFRVSCPKRCTPTLTELCTTEQVFNGTRVTSVDVHRRF